MRDTFSTVAPGPSKPVEVLTKSNPAAAARVHADTIWKWLRRDVSRISFKTVGEGAFWRREARWLKIVPYLLGVVLARS